MKGYYHEATIINRHILEGALICQLSTEKEGYAWKWFRGELRLRELRRILNLNNSRDFRDAYRMMSECVHLDIRSLNTIVELERKKKILSVYWVPKFEKELARNYLVPAISYMLISHLSVSYISKFDEDFMVRILRFRENFNKRCRISTLP